MRWKRKIGLWMAMLAIPAVAGAADLVNPFTESYQEIPMKTTVKEGTLLVSDSPEYPNAAGILAKGTIKGRGRIYYYNVNASGAPVRLVIYADNKKNADIQIERNLTGDGSMDYISTGRTLSYREATVEAAQPEKIKIKAKKPQILAAASPDPIPDQMLVSGILEVNTKKPVTFGVAVLPADANTEEAEEKALKDLEVLPADFHDRRGVFPMAIEKENEAPWDVAERPGSIVIGDGKIDSYYPGYDELDKVNRSNAGNFGMEYDITVHTKGTGQYRLLFNPLGGIYEGTFTVWEKVIPSVYNIEGHNGYFGNKTIYDVWNMGVWNAGNDLHIHFTVAGAAYLPFRFLLIPVNGDQKVFPAEDKV